MRLTNGGDYAVRCVAYLASLPPGRVIPLREVAANLEDVPESFLAKLAGRLARAGIVELLRGKNGGLRLARAPAEISLLQVVEAVIGPIALNDCVLRPRSCRHQPTCPVHVVWTRATNQLRETLGSANFESLASGDACLSGFNVDTE